MPSRPDLAHLIGGVVLALAACVLAGAHTAVPSFVPFAALTLIGIGGGLSIAPGLASKADLPDLGNTAAEASAQVALPPSTPRVVVPVAPAPAQPPAAVIGVTPPPATAPPA